VVSSMDYLKALEFATKKHEGSIRIGGESYITHPIEVAKILREKGYDEKVQITALFHDLLEDTDATETEILQLSSEHILHDVKLLTKEKDYEMEEYISRIRKSKNALSVKLADRLHNLRCALTADEGFRRRYIAETWDYYHALSSLTPFEKDIREAVEELSKTILNEFYCTRCKKWLKNEYIADKESRDGRKLCKSCLVDYEISFDEFED